MKTNEIEALRLFAKLTGGSFDVWQIAGPANSGRRQMLLAALEGFTRPKAACGVTLIKNQFAQMAIRHGFEMPQACIAVQDARLAQWFALQLRETESDRERESGLHNLSPMLRFNLADDGNGDLHIVKADAWSAAFYHVHGR